MNGVACGPGGDTGRVAFAQLFSRDPLDRPTTRAEIVGRLTGLLVGDSTALQRATRAWSGQQTRAAGEFLWSSDGGDVQVAVHPVLYPDDSHSVISLECPLGHLDLLELVDVLRGLGERVDADLGHLTVLGRQNGVLPTMYLTPLDLRRWLPEVWHGLLLGAPYSELIGSERIRHAPAHSVERNGPWGFWVQLHPWDAVADGRCEDDNDARREKVREHLGPDLFWRPDRRVYRTPHFGVTPSSPSARDPGSGSATATPAHRPHGPGPLRVSDRETR